MKTIDKIYEAKQVINKSEFICTLIPVSTQEEAIEQLNLLRKKYYDATHNCYAYITGLNGEYARFSDDGEPSQTAGIIILDVLKKNNLTNVLACVTRYFGGIKLGASGLVRAYSSSTALAVKDISPLHLQTCSDVLLTVSYNNYNKITRIINEFKELNKEFTDQISLIILVPVEKIETLKKSLIEATKDQISINVNEPYSFFA